MGHHDWMQLGHKILAAPLVCPDSCQGATWFPAACKALPLDQRAMTPTRAEQMIREYGGRLETPPLAEVIARRD
jgi:hypothetical protein